MKTAILLNHSSKPDRWGRSQLTALYLDAQGTIRGEAHFADPDKVAPFKDIPVERRFGVGTLEERELPQAEKRLRELSG